MPAAPIVFGREFFEVDPRSTALIIIDMQNAFVAEGATYETPGARTMMPKLEQPDQFRPRTAHADCLDAVGSQRSVRRGHAEEIPDHP